MQLLLFIGLQASGKSTYYKQKFIDTHLRLSMDMLRTRNRESILLTACLQSKQPLVIDNTNPTPAVRAKYLGPAKKAKFKTIAYYFQSKLEDCKRRNEQRPPKQIVPLNGLLGVYARLTRPTLAEGFDELWYVHVDPATSQFVTEPWDDNPSANEDSHEV